MKRKRITVLAIDDDPGDLKILRRHLEAIPEWETELVAFNDWETARPELRRRTVDVILLDYLLGGETGLDILRQIRESGDERPVIVLTGQGNERIAAEITRAGADDYLIKGELTPDLLSRSIRYAIEYRQAEEDRLKKERLQGVLEMAGAACHELNQPMQLVSAYAEFLLRRISEDDPAYELVQKVREGIDRMAQITRKLNNITRYEVREYIEGTKIIDLDKASFSDKETAADACEY